MLKPKVGYERERKVKLLIWIKIMKKYETLEFTTRSRIEVLEKLG